MTKSRRRPARRTAKAASKSKSKTTSRSKTARRKTLRKPTGKPIQTRGDVVYLKPLYEEIGLKIRELETLRPSERVKFAIARLSQHQAEFEDICGPTMDVFGEEAPVG